MAALSVDDILARWTWSPIRHCPGRFVLAGGPSTLAPQTIAGTAREPAVFHVPAARDPVLVTPLPGGGLISYRRPDGTFVHTLNTPDGFARKLAQLAIDLTGADPAS